jgi:dTDP-4-dehydrorhamnose reductase
MTKKKILITGANGLLGQKLIDLYLKKDDREIIATGVGPCRHPEKNRVRYYEMDISNKAQVDKVFDEIKPDAVIHTAAMTNVDACEHDREMCDALNVTAVDYIAGACALLNAHMVHISTDFIFDGKEGPLDEEAVPNPLSYYGWSKLKGENIVKEKAGKWAILRTVLVYGVVHDMSRSNIVLWAKGALEKQQDIKVVDDQFRTPTLAEDLAIGCFLAEDKGATGIFNISGKDFMSIYELVERVADFYGLSKDNMHRSDSSTLNQPAKRPPITGFKLGKAIRDLGYKPHSFEEGLALLNEQLSSRVR